MEPSELCPASYLRTDWHRGWVCVEHVEREEP